MIFSAFVPRGSKLFAALMVGLTLTNGGACTSTGESRTPDPRPTTPPPVTPTEGARADTPEDASNGAASPVDVVAADYWDYLMRTSPEWATESGDHRFDDRLADTGPKARAVQRKTEEALLARARAIHDVTDPQEQVSLALLIEALEQSIEDDALGLATLNVHQMYGPQAMLPSFVMTKHPMKTEDDVKNLLQRYRAMPALFAGQVDDLRLGLAAGRTAPRVVVDRVVTQLERLLEKKAIEETAFGKVVTRLPASFDDATRAKYRAEILHEAQVSALRAFEDYRRFLVDEYRPKARTTVGLQAMPGGDAIYAKLVRDHTTTKLTPDQIHQVGLDELARIEAKILTLAKERDFEGDVPTFLATLRAERNQYAPSRDALLESFRAALRRADVALPTAFAQLPKLPYRVEPLDAARERDAPAAYYQPGSVDDNRPGVFTANLYRFEERPLFNSDVLAFHEAVPGHHLQIATAQELKGIPQFRTESYTTAYVEGWGLYSERLADELGLYHDLESRVGYLGFAAWRASRLVVDTGIHAKGWSRQQAIDFLGAHTTLGPVDVENEIDRYIAMPGQALAYMIGCLHILSLREYASATLGDAFDLKAFHAAVLGAGALPLGVLDAHVTQALQIPPRPVAAQTLGIVGH